MAHWEGVWEADAALVGRQAKVRVGCAIAGLAFHLVVQPHTACMKERHLCA
jgi:hypothetical protein